MEPGDVLYFHANTLHRSDQNRSDRRRWSTICCYNARSNDSFKESHHPRYTPLETTPDSAIREAGDRRLAPDTDHAAWLDERDDLSARQLAAR